MSVILIHRDELAKVPGLQQELDQLVTSINRRFTAEHTGDTGVHTDVTAESVTTPILDLTSTSQTTVGAAGGASALPATPTGYIPVLIGGVEYVIPYYAQS